MKPIRQLKNPPKNLRQLFKYRNRWTQGRYFRNSFGYEAEIDDPDVCSCCLVGGLRIFNKDNYVVKSKIRSYLFGSSQRRSIQCWNDHATFEDVQKLVNDLKL